MNELDRRIAAGDVPASLRGVLMPFAWDLGKLLDLDLTVGTIEVSEYIWMLDLPLWREQARWFAVTPNEVRRHPARHREQWERTLAADLRSPVHVTQRTQARWVIVDGVHRLLRCVLDDQLQLPARTLPSDRWSEIVIRDDVSTESP